MGFNIYSNCAHTFGAELYQGCKDGFVNIAVFPREGAKHYFSLPISQAKTSALTAAIASYLDANLYFQVTPIATPISGHRRGAVKDVISVPALFADVDYRNPNKNEQRLPVDSADALRMFAEGGFLPPTIIVETGRGLHAYWVFEQPVVISSEEDRADMVAIAADFGSAFRSYAMTKFNWKFDTVSDLARLGRLPGTFNVKGETPLPVSWRTDPASQRYTLERIGEVCMRFEAVAKRKGRLSAVKTTTSGSCRSASVDEALRRSDGKWWIGKTLNEAVQANAASMVEGCAFLHHAIEEAAALPEPEWFDALRFVARAENGAEVAHAMSAPHAGYDHAETEKKFAHAAAYDSDLTCDYIVQAHGFPGCNSCPFRTKLRSPVELGDRSRDHVELLINTAFIEQTDRFYNLKRITKDGVKPETFSRSHGEKRLFTSAAQAVTSDVLAIKAHERAYRPDKPPGTFEEGATIYLNYYRGPQHAPGASLPRLFYRHLRYLVPDRAERKVVIRWLAHMVQRPWEKLGYAVALIGGQGTGKSWLLSLMSKVLGADNVRTSGGRSVTSQFNGHFAGRVLLGLEEVTITGRAESYEGLKAVITNDIAEFERKHVNAEELQTPRGVLVLSNDPYALHLPADDRRFFVVQTSPVKHSGGDAYYRKLFALDDALVADVYWSLKSVNLDNFVSKTPPFMTTAKMRMADYSRPDIDVMVEELVEQRCGPFAYALAIWDEIREFVRDHSADKTLTDKRIKRALETARVVIDPQKRQCRLGGGARPILYLVRSVDEVSKFSATELGALYKSFQPRYDAVVDGEDDGAIGTGRAISTANMVRQKIQALRVYSDQHPDEGHPVFG